MARPLSDTASASGSRRAICAHCGAPLSGLRPVEVGPLPTASVPPGAQFCCGGCRLARELIEGAGLQRYYDLSGGKVAKVDLARSERPWLLALLESARSSHPEQRLVLSLDVQGLHCAACVWVLQALFQRLPGALHLDIDPGVARLRLTFDGGAFPLERYLDDLLHLGYRAGPPCRKTGALSDGLGVRLGVTLAIAMNAMALSFATYFGLEPGDPDGLHALFGWVNLALSTIALLVAGPVFIRGALGAIWRGTLHLDVPIALGLILAWGGSVALFLSGRPELAYFDTLDIFLALMLLGRWAQLRFLEVNRRLLLDDDGFTHVRVKVVLPGGTALRPLADLAPGTRFLVAPRELVVVRATLEGPAAELDLSSISGESEPIACEMGGTVPAGARLAGQSARVLVATEAFAASHLVELLRSHRSDGARGSDRFWHRFTTAWVLTVLLFAALVALVWWPASPLLALRHATALLVVTCPCAIGLATPLAYELAHLRLRKLGLLARRPALLDRVRHVAHVVFDKTGTLTLSRLSLDAASQRAVAGLGEPDRGALFQLTARSNHPKSRAIQEALSPQPLDPTLEVIETPGRGLSSASHILYGDGQALVFASHSPLARLTFEETLRSDAKAQIAALTRLGLTVHLATGDAPDKAALVAVALGIPAGQVHARVTPEGKALLVRTLGQDRTLFMGDGVNDALAFDLAAVAGTPSLDFPTLPARADFVVTSGDLGPLADLVRLARRVHTITRRNIAIAAVYNALALVAALQGWLSPVVAAIAMPASSLLVLALTAQSSRERAPQDPQPEPGTELWMPST